MASITDTRAHSAHGLSRRRVLLGTAWATPAIVVGIAAPPAAASTLPQPAPPPAPLPQGTGVANSPNSGQASGTYQTQRWNSDLGQSITAVVLSDYIQNVGNQTPTTSTMTATFTVPVGGASSLAWGMGNGNGLPPGSQWMHAASSISGGIATLTLVYTGAPMGPWGGVSISNLWFQTATDPRPCSATLRVDATYQSGQVSSHTVTVPVS